MTRPSSPLCYNLKVTQLTSVLTEIAELCKPRCLNPSNPFEDFLFLSFLFSRSEREILLASKVFRNKWGAICHSSFAEECLGNVADLLLFHLFSRIYVFPFFVRFGYGSELGSWRKSKGKSNDLLMLVWRRLSTRKWWKMCSSANYLLKRTNGFSFIAIWRYNKIFRSRFFV